MRLRVAVLALSVLMGCQKHIPIPDVTAPTDAATVARGEYLGTTLCACVACHSPRDWTKWSGPIDDARVMQGGENTALFDGLSADTVLHPPNLTPTRLASWSDGEVVRAITTGMGKGNHALFPSMPYNEYRALAVDDALALVAWLRTLKPAPETTPERKLPFPLGMVVNAIPKPVELRAKAPRLGDADYGAYVTHIAGCEWCHSAVDGHGKVIPGGELAGGHAFTVPPPGAGTVLSANLTPDEKTGLGAWKKEDFIARFRGVEAKPVAPGAFNTVMTWTQFHGASEADLGAIYDYLRTVPAKVNAVEKFKAANAIATL